MEVGTAVLAQVPQIPEVPAIDHHFLAHPRLSVINHPVTKGKSLLYQDKRWLFELKEHIIQVSLHAVGLRKEHCLGRGKVAPLLLLDPLI